jgi:4-amino-4-deoxy-L-arabinose transferase-like glycosyltransferase
VTSAGPVVARPVRLAQVAVAILLLIKLWMSAAAPPVGDEAYYWMWGQKLGWSYLDHPPLHAWLLGAMSVFGWNYFSLRALTWVTLGGTLWIFWLWARRIKPEDPAAWWWPSAAVYLATPLFFTMTSVAFHDHLLIFLSLASAHAFLVFAEKWETGGRGFGWVYGAAVLLGLAVLTKYNAVLVGIGIAAFFIVRKPLRPLWRSPHLYLAAALSVALQAPVLWWNFAEGFASANFHLSERWGGDLFRLRPLNVLGFIALALIFVSPFLFPAIGAMLRRPLGTVFADRVRTLALSVFVVSTLAMLAFSFFAEVYFYWNIVAFLLLMPLLAGWINRRWVLAAHLCYGLVFAAGAAVSFTAMPIGNMLGRYDWMNSSTFGWPAVAERVEALRSEHDTGFIAAARYTTAAQLGFAMHDPEVTAIADRRDQYDFWFEPEAHIGEDAIVVSDPQIKLGQIAPYFEDMKLLETIRFERFGKVIYRARIYLATGFRLPAAR